MDRPATAPADSPLGRLLLEEITPVVMVLSTPLAEEACRKNGLDLVQMLRPFCSFQNIDVPVRTASEQPYRLQEFRLRMVYASKVRQMSPQVAEGLLRQVVSDANADLQPSVPQHEALVTAHDTECLPSWLQTFNRELLHTLSFSGHEAFDHPVACLLVVSTNDDKPINRFVDLFNTEQLPSLLNEGTMDPKILKRYLLLHDNQNGSQEKAGHILAEMRSTYGVHDSRLLCINSAQDMVWDEANNPWLNNKIGELTSRDVACFLSSDDLNEIRDFMQDLCSKCIIPHMEQKIRALNQQVSAIRKGFRNQIRNLWWRKGKEDTPDTPNGPTYTFSSIESQMRVLGDYAFMLRDYELALSNYRLLSTDYKLDKSWKHYAGAQEMVGLCLFMLDQSRKDSEYCMENAFHTYERTGSSVSRYATRCGIWWAEMLKIRSQHKEAASVYVRITDGEPSLHAAVILEQASCCYSFSNPPMLRKYGFHLVLAGNRYYISEEKKHAIRTYQSALSVYKGNSWSYINDHVHFNMGRWYAFLDMFDAAIEHMLEVLACSHQSMATQELFLGDFLRIVKSVGKKLEVPKLQLPHIDMSSLKIIFEDHRTYASSSAVDVGESLWQTLEEDMVPTTFTIKSNWLESSRKLRPLKKYNDASICVIGEPIKVYLEFTNPLKISLSVSDVSLICELSTSSAGSEVDENASATGAQGNVLLSGPSDNRELKSDDSSFDLSKINFVLGSAETRRVELDVTPKIQGFLKIVGVRWMFADSVVGYCNFNTDIKRKHGKARVIEDSSGSSLCFIVVKGLPKLEGYIHDLPKKTYAGDLRLLMLELQNQSEYSVKNLKMKISHPRFLTPGSSDNMNLKYPGCLEKQIDSKRMDVKESKVGKSSEKSRGLLFSFPNDIKIQGGDTFQWPLWLHSGIAGNVSLCISIYYEMENFSSDMSYRTLRMNYKLEVLPSLDISISITPYPSKLQEFLVRMDVVNKTNAESFLLRQLSTVAGEWDISTLPSHASNRPSQLLLAGQALLCFFKLKGVKSIDMHSSKGSDAILDSADSSEALIDNSRSPLADFHHHERLHQENFHQGRSSTVDLVLISQLVRSDPGEPPQLFSHHSCHCRVASKSPVWWLLDGPHTIHHDFASSFCEASLVMRIRNCAETAASVKIVTFDGPPLPGESSDRQTGWHDVPLANDMKVGSEAQGTHLKKPSSGATPPFIWSGASSTRVSLEPDSTVEIPMHVCIFSAGIYDLSNYEVHWSLESSESDSSDRDLRSSSGTSRGHPFYLTTLQTAR